MNEPTEQFDHNVWKCDITHASESWHVRMHDISDFFEVRYKVMCGRADRVDPTRLGRYRKVMKMLVDGFSDSYKTNASFCFDDYSPRDPRAGDVEDSAIVVVGNATKEMVVRAAICYNTKYFPEGGQEIFKFADQEFRLCATYPTDGSY